MKLIKNNHKKAFLNEYPANDRYIRSRRLRLQVDYKPLDITYYILASCIPSSNIEGNPLDVSGFFKYRNHIKEITIDLQKAVLEIEDLKKAYLMASHYPLNKTYVMEAHAILTKRFLPKHQRGVVRDVDVFVGSRTKRIYTALSHQLVNKELDKLFDDIHTLLHKKLSFKETFYYASMIHLWMAKIHPFRDGNGRIARLVEKWFLISKLGNWAFLINAEKYYWENSPDYYANLNIGTDYDSIDWNLCYPFLLMLSDSFVKSITKF